MCKIIQNKLIVFLALFGFILLCSNSVVKADEVVQDNATVRGLRHFQGGDASVGSSPLSGFRRYSTGYDAAGVSRSSANPLAKSLAPSKPGVGRPSTAMDNRIGKETAAQNLNSLLGGKPTMYSFQGASVGRSLEVRAGVPNTRVRPSPRYRNSFASTLSRTGLSKGNSLLAQTKGLAKKGKLASLFGLASSANTLRNSRKGLASKDGLSKRPTLLSPLQGGTRR